MEAPPVSSTPTPPAPAAPAAPAAPSMWAPFAALTAPRVPRPPRPPRVMRRGHDDDDDAPRVSIDTTFAVQPGVKLSVFNFGGSVAFRTWARNAVRLSAERAADDRIVIARSGSELKLESISFHGTPEDMDIALTVPAWLPVSLTGVNNDVTAEGLTGGLQVETVHGDIVARRLSGPVDLHSVEGVVDLTDARGKIDVSSVNDAVRLSDVVGEISAEAVNGDVHLVGVDSRKVDVTSVSGDVIYDSPVVDGGQYTFSTHDGDISVGLPDPPNATVDVTTFGGDFASAFTIRPERSERGKRLHFTLGNGAAKVNLESFQGSIEILRSGQRELRRRIDEAMKARQQSLQKWGEWNPTRRMEWKERKTAEEKTRKEVHIERHTETHSSDDDADDDKP